MKNNIIQIDDKIMFQYYCTNQTANNSFSHCTDCAVKLQFKFFKRINKQKQKQICDMTPHCYRREKNDDAYDYKYKCNEKCSNARIKWVE